MHAPPRPSPPPRSKRRGIAARVMEANPQVSQAKAEAIARHINRKQREGR